MSDSLERIRTPRMVFERMRIQHLRDVSRLLRDPRVAATGPERWGEGLASEAAQASAEVAFGRSSSSRSSPSRPRTTSRRGG